MIQLEIFVLSTLTVLCSAGGGGYGGSMNGGMAMAMAGMSSGGYGGSGSGMGLRMGSSNGGYGGQQMMESKGYAHNGGPITAAVQSRHSVEVRPVQTHNEQVEPQVIEVDSGDMPIILNFNSRSSRLMVKQTHTPSGAGEVQQTSSEDEPHRLVHEVVKPVIQEVREVITPYRRIVQEVRPVVEEVHTIVAKGEKRRSNDYGNGNGGQGGYGGNGMADAGSQGGYGGNQGGYGGPSSMAMSMGSMDGGYGGRSNGMSNGMALSGNGLSMGSSKSYKS